MTDLDALEAQAEAQLVQCGPCDFGLVEHACSCPKGDPRPVISQLLPLIAEVRKLREDDERAERDIERLNDEVMKAWGEVRSRDRELERLRYQRDAVLAYTSKIVCPNCDHSVSSHENRDSICNAKLPLGPCGCDWTSSAAEEIRALLADASSSPSESFQEPPSGSGLDSGSQEGAETESGRCERHGITVCLVCHEPVEVDR